MGILLREVMKIYPFSKNKLIAGASGLDRQVESCNIQEVPEVEKWLKGGEILFSAGYALTAVDDKKSFLHKLNTSGIAAIVLKPGPYLPTIPDNIIEYCDELGLPLFQMPEDIPYMSCFLPIFERIMNQQLWLLQKSDEVHNDILKEIINGGGLDGICQQLFVASGNKTILYSASGRVLAESYSTVGEDEHELEQDLDEDLLHLLKTISSSQCKVSPLQKIKFQNNYWLFIPVQIRGEVLAYLFQSCGPDDDDRFKSLLLNQTSQLIALEIVQEQILIEREHQIAEQLLEDILLRRYKDKDIILRRAMHLQLELRNPYIIFVINADAFEKYLTSHGENTSEQHIQAFKEKVRQITRLTLSEKINAFLLMNEGFGLIGMVEINKQCSMDLIDQVLVSLLEHLKEGLPELEFSIGVSRETSGVSQAEVALEEAQRAIRVSRRRQDGIKISEFSNLGSFVFLSELSGSDSLKRFCHEKLGAIEAYDRKNNAILMSTLEAFLECDGHLQRTADSLFVHKNSVIYRLNKIRDMTGIDLSDYRTLFDLHLCILMRDFI